MAAWWLLLHALLALAVWALAPGVALSGLLGAVILVHAGLGRAHLKPRVLRCDNGRWEVPGTSRSGLELGPGTVYTELWARLELVVPSGRSLRVLLVRDQLHPEQWRWLQARLRG